ncbi:PREDICTED: membrane-spanning 4-domains subfamily A member 13-like [Elephantulus edwardii]|uniref:membrane-spanning 4-domains subfamily A member 13-like n=1 Tax=Elephantulus edwardii TaxID=28737 RepID=UPI0003F0C84C|nr:PREDICTED: membrane-spanning 4-domains subfamily A member 13-like [Elephantulus edwardii]
MQRPGLGAGLGPQDRVTRWHGQRLPEPEPEEGNINYKKTKHPHKGLAVCTLLLNTLSSFAGIVAIILTLLELSKFHSVSYRNYGHAKLGREVSQILLFSYNLELYTHSSAVCICVKAIKMEVLGKKLTTLYKL